MEGFSSFAAIVDERAFKNEKETPAVLRWPEKDQIETGPLKSINIMTCLQKNIDGIEV